MLKPVLFVVCTLCLSFCTDSLAAEDWGTIKGRIVYVGQLPAVQPLEITRDEDVCGQHKLTDESLIVNRENRGLKNVVVWLYSKKEVPVHPSLQEMPKPAKLDNKNCRFVPRIVRLRANQTLQAVNSDPVAHNVAVYARRNQPFSVVVPGDQPLERSFARGELLPIRVDCSIHAWMRAYLIITDHPYSAVTDNDGSFTIKNVPQGEWDFRFWHERPGYLKTLLSKDEKEHKELSRGTLRINLNREVDLGDMKVPEVDFAIEDDSVLR